MTPEQRRARGYAARVILEDPTMNDGWNEIEQELRDQWEACWWPRKRNRIWTELRHIRRLRQKLAKFAGASRD